MLASSSVEGRKAIVVELNPESEIVQAAGMSDGSGVEKLGG
jgi:hypothetical protein